MTATNPKGAYAVSGLSLSSAMQCFSLYCLRPHILKGASWHAWTQSHINGPCMHTHSKQAFMCHSSIMVLDS